MRIYDSKFKYTPALSTNITSTWKRFGFKPTTTAEREARQRRALAAQKQEGSSSASVTHIESVKRKVRAQRA